MKKLLLLILITLILILTIFTAVNGFNIAGIEILGIEGIQLKNEKLQEKFEIATKLATVDFPKKEKEIIESVKELEDKKVTYEDMVAVSSAEDVESARHIPSYGIEFLYTRIGIHATAEGVNLKMDIVNGTGGAFNIKFTAEGSYVGITEFITDIEDDSQLGFKIEEFSMKPGESDSNLRATFTCKNLNITGMSETTPEKDTEDKEGNKAEDGNTTNTSNTANTNNTSNNTNSANTSNTTNKTNTSNTSNTANTSD